MLESAGEWSPLAGDSIVVTLPLPRLVGDERFRVNIVVMYISWYGG